MSTLADKLTKLRREEQESRGYSPSSRWYTALSNAISFLELAETASAPKEQFTEGWSAIYNLFMLYGKSGDEESKRYHAWVADAKNVPEVHRYFCESAPELPLRAFRDDVGKAAKALLKPHVQQELQMWRTRPGVPEKACPWFFSIIREIRNSCTHPDFNPNTAATKKGLASAAACLVPVAAAAIKAMIEHPVEGTTGKTTAYRSFLWPFLKNNDSFFSDYYLERLFPDEELGAFPEDQSTVAFKQIAKQLAALRAKLPNADLEETVNSWCKPVLFKSLGITPQAGARIVTGDHVFNPPFVVLNSGAKPKAEYSPKEAAEALACLIWALPYRVSLDAVATDVEFVGLTVVEVAHRALSASGVPWAVLTNGKQFRVLGKGTAHKPRCFLEIDLDATLDRPDATEALLAFRYWLGLFSAASLVEKDDHGHTRLNRVLIGSDRHGQEIGDELKENVYTALEELGEGALNFLRANSAVADAWRAKRAPDLGPRKFLESDVLLTDTYQETMSLMYRLLFLFYAESRNLLPMENDMYRETYSLESIRDEIISRRDDPDKRRWFGKGAFDLWDRLKELFAFVNTGWGKVIPAYNGGLFDPEQHEFLETIKIDDYHLSRAVDLLSRTRPGSGQERGRGRRKITYRDLDVRHLGSIYEGILEYSARIAEDNLVILRRGSGSKAYEEYATISGMSVAEKKQFNAWQEAVAENPDAPDFPRGCSVLGSREKGSYFLVYGGRESKRKSSGSYYTPDYVVQYIVENTLGPLVRGERREVGNGKHIEGKKQPHSSRPLTSDEILQLKVLDPAMGSGHFLVAAVEYLARAYGESLVRERAVPDARMTEEEFVRYNRLIAERCIYGVDINPMAVELSKVSLWLFTMDRGHPLSFLNHHLKLGNSLVGAWLQDLGRLPQVSAKGAISCGSEVSSQLNMFERTFRSKIPGMVRDLFQIIRKESLTYADVQAKKSLDAAIEATKRPFQRTANAWTATCFGERTPDYYAYLSDVKLAEKFESLSAHQWHFFHWQIAFPEIFFDNHGNQLDQPGFDVCIGNPPYVFARETLTDVEKNFYAYRFARTSRDKPNLYIMFMELAIRLARHGGAVGMITPNAWLGIDSGEPLRNLILGDAPPRKCVVCLYDVFPGVGVEPVIVSLRRGEKPDTCLCKVQLSAEEFGASPYKASAARWARLPKMNFAVFSSEEAAALLDKVTERGASLGDVTSVKAAMQAYEVGKGDPPQTAADVRDHVYDRTEKDSPDTHKYLEGADVVRYGIRWSGSWLCYGPWLSQPRELTIFSRPRVLVREVTGQYPRMLIAAPVTKLYLNNKSIVNIVCDKDKSYSPWIIAGVLNSKLGSFVFKHTGVKANRGLFPKVVISDLQSFPVPSKLDERIACQLEEKVRAMCDEIADGRGEEARLQAACDRLVCELYRLSPEDVRVLEEEAEVTCNATD